jgi:hypothetical protein
MQSGYSVVLARIVPLVKAWNESLDKLYYSGRREGGRGEKEGERSTASNTATRRHGDPISKELKPLIITNYNASHEQNLLSSTHVPSYSTLFTSILLHPCRTVSFEPC